MMPFAACGDDRDASAPAPAATSVPTAATSVPSSGPVTTRPTGDRCRPGDPLANVYRPGRLQVIEPCKTVTGTVMTFTRDSGEGDGDLKFTLKPDPEFANVVNEINQRDQYGYLVVEIVPADQPGCSPGRPPRPREEDRDYGICTGANVTLPEPATHVAVTGPLVLDRPHGWMEIHPAWVVEAIRN
jgi:hypothetical protein